MTLDISSGIASSKNLLQQAEIFIKLKITSEPENIDYLFKLVHILRQRGHINESLKYLLKILQFNPDNSEAKQIKAILNQELIDDRCTHGFCPTPFLYIEDYLSDEQFQIVWNTMILNKKYFIDSRLAEDYQEGRLDTSIRKSLTLNKNKLNNISDWFLDKVLSELPKVCLYLQIEPFTPTQLEIQLTRHGSNDFFKIHQDSGNKENIRNRILTFVYYFHKVPKCFHGGEILLFDTNTDTDEYNTRYTKLIPKCNSIIFFPSNFFHQVTPVDLVKNDFEDGRFAIHGWLHKNDI